MNHQERIRIWFVRTALDNIGGAERVIAQIMTHLPEDRFEPISVWLYEPGAFGEELAEKGIRTHTRLAKSRSDPWLFARLRKLAKQDKPHIIFTTENALACFWSGALRKLRLAPRLVIGFHTTRLQKKSVGVATRFAAPSADRLIALSPSHQHYWEGITRCPPEKFQIIPNGINLSRFHPAEDRLQARAEAGLPTDCPVVGLIAHLKPVKNLPLFVEVANRVLAAGEKAHFVIVGDGSEREPILAEIERRGLQAHFTLPGATSDPAAWHQRFDFLLLTSHSEAMPLTILEANACGAPAVATDVGGVRDVILQGETGFYSPAGEAEPLTQYLLQLIRDPALRQRMGETARQRAIQEYSLEGMLQRYSRLFEELASRVV